MDNKELKKYFESPDHQAKLRQAAELAAQDQNESNAGNEQWREIWENEKIIVFTDGKGELAVPKVVLNKVRKN